MKYVQECFKKYRLVSMQQFLVGWERGRELHGDTKNGSGVEDETVFGHWSYLQAGVTYYITALLLQPGPPRQS